MSPRRMEEASVAGESPDKSEQQKSSGTTRSEADPRLAVFREPGSPAESGSGVDTATAVFRTQRSGPEAEDAEDAGGAEGGAVDEVAADADADADADAANAADADATGADVARVADVEAGVEDDGAAEAAGDGDSRDGGDADAGTADGDAGDGVDAAAEKAASSDSADKAASSDPAETDEVTAQGPEAAARTAAGAAEAAEGAEGPVEASEAGPGAAEASGEPEGPLEPVEAAEGAEPADADESVASEKAEESGKSEPVASGPAAEPEKVVKPETAVEPDEAAETEGAETEGGDARLRAAVAAWVSTSDDAKSDVAESESDAEAEDETKAGAESESESESAPEADETSADETSAADSSAEDSSDRDAPDSTSEARVPRTREASGDEAQPVGDERGIDQATAVFKTPKLPRVDQPTTALKITPPPAKPKPETGTRPESPAERTSKFVPLRADDVRPAPAPRAPETPSPAAAPGAGRQQPDASLSGAERTRQQPMPPRPPLDLLAELTNTPPPPETPVRTAVRRVKIWTPLVLLLLIVFAIVQMVRPLPTPVLTMTAQSSYTFKGGDPNLSWPDQGQSAVTVDGVGSLGSAGAQKPAPIASVAKIMTAYVVLKEHPLTGKQQGEKITVDQQAEDESKLGDESTAPISKGQQFTEKQLLQLLMIPSGNNAARLFARWDSSETEFVAKMNAAAKDLGMTGTTYTDPSGLKKTTVSTAVDQLKLARAVMQNEVLREIVDTPQIDIEGIDTTIYNNNTILLEPGVSGIKTGSSTPAGGNLVWSANTVVDGKKLWIYGAVMGQQAGTGQPYDSLVMSLNNSLKLIKDAQEAVTSATVVKKGDVVGYVDDGFGGHTPLVATGDLKAKGWPGLKVELSVQGNGEEISRSMKAGTKVGVVTVGTGPGKVSAPVALQQDLKDPAFGQKLTRIG
ncbi:serine hydrolase [Streptomyces sp. NPDC048211]|uniref:D-alanyl-D-alanine carboxypeptidase n=1 Tax=Streptomyces sp. NPDC048211 TaxID=3365516 RepID=UPI00371222F5